MREGRSRYRLLQERLPGNGSCGTEKDKDHRKREQEMGEKIKSGRLAQVHAKKVQFEVREQDWGGVRR